MKSISRYPFFEMNSFGAYKKPLKHQVEIIKTYLVECLELNIRLINEKKQIIKEIQDRLSKYPDYLKHNIYITKQTNKGLAQIGLLKTQINRLETESNLISNFNNYDNHEEVRSLPCFR